MYQVDIKEIDTQLATVIATALKGEDVLILQDQEPLLKLSRVTATKVRRKRGSAKGLVIMADDFDAPLEDFREYM
ncbi:MAG: type II toxin-antitoxin system Phd/YefM family antitoxin [Caldilineaceae bacterium]|jgi:antitoxin (DNA-binding transcriptional repressor) of toxin-antitoxin stability system